MILFCEMCNFICEDCGCRIDNRQIETKPCDCDYEHKAYRCAVCTRICKHVYDLIAALYGYEVPEDPMCNP